MLYIKWVELLITLGQISIGVGLGYKFGVKEDNVIKRKWSA